jgi:RNA polymerase sigma factor (sigma-70 family)
MPGQTDEKSLSVPYPEDMSLVSRCLAHDNAAWEELYGSYSAMCRIIAHKYNCINDFEDLYADFLVKLLGSVDGTPGVLSQYHGEVALKTFLSTVFRHMVIDYLRKKKRDYFMVASEKPIEAYETPDCNRLDSAEVNHVLSDAIARLPEKYKTFIDLYYFHGFKLEKIAAITGCNVSTVSRNLKKVQKALKSHLERLLDKT